MWCGVVWVRVERRCRPPVQTSYIYSTKCRMRDIPWLERVERPGAGGMESSLFARAGMAHDISPPVRSAVAVNDVGALGAGQHRGSVAKDRRSERSIPTTHP